jgi:hypothetical protein
MCIFSGPVETVSNTNIFARNDGEYQYIVYQMNYKAKSDLAMILPIPVKLGIGEDGVKFINLEKHKEFFNDIIETFNTKFLSDGDYGTKGISNNRERKLTIVNVGDFEASFVPTLKDFSRLDEKFKLPDDVWNEIPEYKDYGFVVFKLKNTAKESTVHPMAFKFPTRFPNKIFYPTMHIHDGLIHDEEVFHHSLFCQTPKKQLFGRWKSNNEEMKKDYEGIILTRKDVDKYMECAIFKKDLSGYLPNKDMVYELRDI